jgi:hypothetical protein
MFPPVPRVEDPVVPPGVCIFCRKRPDVDATPWVPGNPGAGCTYGLGHEVFRPIVKVAPQPRKPDAKLCSKCGLHPKNPASATNGCEHIYAQT